MARSKIDPVEAALDRFFDLTPEEQSAFDRERRSLERRLQRFLAMQAPPQATFVQGQPPKKRRDRPPKPKPFQHQVPEQPPEA